MAASVESLSWYEKILDTSANPTAESSARKNRNDLEFTGLRLRHNSNITKGPTKKRNKECRVIKSCPKGTKADGQRHEATIGECARKSPNSSEVYFELVSEGGVPKISAESENYSTEGQ